MGMYMKGLCENVKGAWDWLFHEHISRRIMAVFVIFFLISFFLTYSVFVGGQEAGGLHDRAVIGADGHWGQKQSG